MSEDIVPDFPTADAVAHALVAAARSMGQPLDALPDLVGGGGSVRFRAPALGALRIIYPDVSWDKLGKMVGYAPRSGGPGYQSAIKSGWWDAEGAPAMEAALTALEAL